MKIISGIIRLINKLTFLDYRRKRRRRKRAERSRKIARKITKKHGIEVLFGPFEGLAYESLAAAGSGLTPKLIGSYEKEIQPFIEKLVEKDVQRIINIGCGEGFYAVGMALQKPNAEIYAFDVNKRARRLCRELAIANSVANQITIKDRCTQKELSQLTQEPAIIICDCEGCELQLLDPEQVQSLKTNCDILVELHDVEDREDTESELRARFKNTHTIDVKDFVGRTPSDYPQINFLSKSEKTFAIDENRSQGLKWALLTARN